MLQPPLRMMFVEVIEISRFSPIGSLKIETISHLPHISRIVPVKFSATFTIDCDGANLASSWEIFSCSYNYLILVCLFLNDYSYSRSCSVFNFRAVSRSTTKIKVATKLSSESYNYSFLCPPEP